MYTSYQKLYTDISNAFLPLVHLPFIKGENVVVFIICWVILEIGVYTTIIEDILNLSTLPRSWGGISGNWLFSLTSESRPTYSPSSIGRPHSYKIFFKKKEEEEEETDELRWFSFKVSRYQRTVEDKFRFCNIAGLSPFSTLWSKENPIKDKY